MTKRPLSGEASDLTANKGRLIIGSDHRKNISSKGLIMDFVIRNLRLKELVAIVRENKRFYEDFVVFLKGEGYTSVLDFIQEKSDERAAETITRYLARTSTAKLYDGLLRPYSNAKAKWYFLAWLLRDAATQRLQPLLKNVPGETAVERKTYLLNEVNSIC
jgi:hypothetical protein